MLLSLLVTLITSNALTLKKKFSIYCSRVVIISLSSIIYLGYKSLDFLSLSKGITLFGGITNISTLTCVFSIFLLIISIIILNLNAFYTRKLYSPRYSGFKLMIYKLAYNKDTVSNKLATQYRILEYSLIVIFIITGGIFLMSSMDLISIFLCIELQSYGLYIISCIYRDSESSTFGALIYFLLGGLSSCFILLGSALLYTITGATNLDNIYLIINIGEIFLNDTGLILIYNFPFNDIICYIQYAIIIMVVGFLFKISAAPFHFWSPDVYDGIPTIVTTFVAIVPKISIFIYLLDFVYNTQSNNSDYSWTNILLLSSLLSLIIGSLLGLSQFRVKRLFAYSSISHIGFLLLALSISSQESIQSYIFYIFQYSLSNLNAFLILIAIGYTLFIYINDRDRKDNIIEGNNSPIQFINQIKGFFYINPFISTSLSITIFSFVGIPPTIGFFGKQILLSSSLDRGYIFLSLVAIITSVIGAGYYLNLVKNLYFYKPDYKLNPSLYIPNNQKNNFEISSIDILEEDDFIEEPSTSKYSLLHAIEDRMYYKEQLEQKSIIHAYVYKHSGVLDNNSKLLKIPYNNITINGSLSTIIAILTLLIILFIFTPDEPLNLSNILALNLFKF